MKKTIDYYLNLPYTRELIPEPEGGWFVRIKELPNCMSQGDTPEEAFRMIDEAMRGWLEVELEDGEPIPEPRADDEYSGKFNTRVPKSLHRKLVEQADRDGVSLNQWINTALAEAIGSALAKSPEKNTTAAEASVGATWNGFVNAVQLVLDDVGIRREDGVIDERSFADWLGQNLEEIRIEYHREDYAQALSKARALSALLQGCQKQSPLMRSIYGSVMDITSLLTLTCEMKHKVVEVERLQEQISAIIGSVNSPTSVRIQLFERERYSTADSPHEVMFSSQTLGSGNSW